MSLFITFFWQHEVIGLNEVEGQKDASGECGKASEEPHKLDVWLRTDDIKSDTELSLSSNEKETEARSNLYENDAESSSSSNENETESRWSSYKIDTQSNILEKPNVFARNFIYF